ncbi:hypothetical protein BG004_002999, partial [Podila humilis]
MSSSDMGPPAFNANAVPVGTRPVKEEKVGALPDTEPEIGDKSATISATSSTSSAPSSSGGRAPSRGPSHAPSHATNKRNLRTPVSSDWDNKIGTSLELADVGSSWGKRDEAPASEPQSLDKSASSSGWGRRDDPPTEATDRRGGASAGWGRRDDPAEKQ